MTDKTIGTPMPKVMGTWVTGVSNGYSITALPSAGNLSEKVAT